MYGRARRIALVRKIAIVAVLIFIVYISIIVFNIFTKEEQKAYLSTITGVSVGSVTALMRITVLAVFGTAAEPAYRR